VWQIELDPWGITRTLYNPHDIHQPIKMQGQQLDVETGLFYNRYRYYDPGVGRYTTQDPIGLRGGIHTYEYAMGQPNRYVDPPGLWSTEAHNFFIDKAFQGLSPNNIEAIKSGSAAADYAYFQTDEYTYMHAMSGNKYSKEEAKKKYCQFIREKMCAFNSQLAAARSALARKAAYAQLGMAMHAVMDSTSPAHRGFQKWTGDATQHGPNIPGVRNQSIEDIGSVGPYENETVEKMQDLLNGKMPKECQ
jgi:RHS repeat-associated protein